jgi:hypothetical protein
MPIPLRIEDIDTESMSMTAYQPDQPDKANKRFYAKEGFGALSNYLFREALADMGGLLETERTTLGDYQGKKRFSERIDDWLKNKFPPKNVKEYQEAVKKAAEEKGKKNQQMPSLRTRVITPFDMIELQLKTRDPNLWNPEISKENLST